MPDTLSGVIERVTFHNLENGYCVLRVRAAGHRDLVTVVGHMPQAIAGEYVNASGDWVLDRSHGQQFKSSELKGTPPHTAEGIAKYLGSGLVKGIGPKYARKIVEAFGEKTLDVIDQSPSFLTQVKGIGPKRIQLIREGWKESGAVRGIMAFLMSHGIGTARAVRIYKAYGENAVKLVQENPYRLSEDIWGFGFRTADELALKLGIPRDAPQRIQAAVRHVLSEGSTSKGHVGLPEEIVREETMALTQATSEQVESAVEQLRIADEIVRDSILQASGGNVVRVPIEDGQPLAETLLYLKPLFLAELGVARQINALRSGPHPLPATETDNALAWVESRMSITLADSQRDAIWAALTKKLLVVTGGPGTGKTTIVRAILEMFAAKQQRVLLAAPTGRAAKRLGESTGREAKTIHRLLEYDPGINGFRRGRENPLDVDLLVIDEVSMVDVILMNRLLSAVSPWACVVFVGDRDQLPSVGAGSVLADLIDSGVVAVARLTEIHRQAGSSYIVRAAHAVNHGEQPESAPRGDGDFFYIDADDPATITARILAMVKDRIPAKFGLDPFRDVQILSPMNKSELGVQNLNRLLQDALNPGGGKEVQRFGTTYRVGDKVIQTRNNYQREVFNGDIGRVIGLDEIDQILTVEFDGRPVEYEFNELDELSLAFAISIHKSQGSEYPAVIIPVHTQHFVMLQRNLLYTGITRGRKLVVLVGSRKALWLAVTKAETAMRFSLLKWRLQVGE
ncbi:SF1B family DNA helicase RecD2 [Limnoglobus roseus]|uniref:ATP-dependent RecD-like DNA helicase n=1 Tax=Limnoglobus roseus TaxID=2598579 RepID=A0A5C1A6V1_9BACT|nr:ATP-dependent RecD-like DNA helicase [Limnoglobus roseus]QEL13562.1 ATP-dependent RecD-like DNA helicase [Limnoglobus roseus]